MRAIDVWVLAPPQRRTVMAEDHENGGADVVSEEAHGVLLPTTGTVGAPTIPHPQETATAFMLLFGPGEWNTPTTPPLDTRLRGHDGGM